MFGFGRTEKFYRECTDILVQQIRINKSAAAKFVKNNRKYIKVPFKRGESPTNALIQVSYAILKNFENVDVLDNSVIAIEVAMCLIHSYPESEAAAKFKDLILKINEELDNDLFTKNIEAVLYPKKKKIKKIIELLNELQSQIDSMVSAFYWEKNRKGQTDTLSKLSSHLVLLLDAVGSEEFESFYKNADTMAKTAILLAAVMSANTKLMDVFNGYEGIDFDDVMDKADAYREYMFEKYNEAMGV